MQKDRHWHVSWSLSHLDVRVVVGGQVDSEGVGRMLPNLFVNEDHAVVLSWSVTLDNGPDRGQGRHAPLDVAAGVVHGRLDQGLTVLHVQDAKPHVTAIT